jgi:hypothetical protein
LKGENGQRSIFQVFSLDGQDVLLVDRQHLVDSRAEGLDVDSMKLLLIVLMLVVFLVAIDQVLLLLLSFLLELVFGAISKIQSQGGR